MINLLQRLSGIALIIAGTIAGFLPFIPGFVLVLLGLELLGLRAVVMERVVVRYQRWKERRRSEQS